MKTVTDPTPALSVPTSASPYVTPAIPVRRWNVLAIAGLVIGYLGIVLIVALVAVWVTALAAGTLVVTG